MHKLKTFLLSLLLATVTLLIIGCSGGEADYTLDEVKASQNKIIFLSSSYVTTEKNDITILELKVRSDSNVTFTIVGGDEKDLFAIDQTNNILTYAGTIDKNTAFTDPYYINKIVVRAENLGGTVVSQVISIQVVDNINAISPTIVPGYITTPVIVHDDLTTFTTIEVNNPRAPKTSIIYSLSGRDSNLFTISVDGELSLISTVPYDPSNHIFEVEVTATDSFYATLKDSTGVITVTVVETAADLKPAIISSHFDYPENSTAPIQIEVHSNIPDTLRYSLSGTDAYYFKVDSVTGALTFDVYYVLPNYEYPEDSNGDNTYELDVIAIDGNGKSDQKTITITVINVSDAPADIMFDRTKDISLSVKDKSALSFFNEKYDESILANPSPTNGDLTFSIVSITNADSKVSFSLSQYGVLNIDVGNTSPSTINVNIKVEEIRGEVSYQTLNVNITE